MKDFAILATILFAYVVNIQAECPTIDSIPVMNSDGTNFVCAERWDGTPARDPIEACNGNSWLMYKGDDVDTGDDGSYWPVSSLIVKAGCTFYGWEHHGYTGKLLKYYGPGVYPDGCVSLYDEDTCTTVGGFPSYKCRCQQDPITCVPADGWERIMQCDNSVGSTSTTCKYKKTIGTTYSAEVQESMSIDTAIEDSMTVSFFGMFSDTLSISVATGYDWTTTSSAAKSEEQSYEVDTDVPPGTVVMIDGAIGYCGGSTVKTELFKISTYDQDGQLLSTKFEGQQYHKNVATIVDQNSKNFVGDHSIDSQRQIFTNMSGDRGNNTGKGIHKVTGKEFHNSPIFNVEE